MTTQTTPKQPMIPEAVFQAAWQFSRASERLLEGGNVCAVPAVVNETFCIELCLKCLLLDETGQPHKGHELESLFRKLRAETRQRIEDYYKERMGGMLGIEYRSPARGMVYTADLANVLRTSNTAFHDWRYLFEATPNPAIGLQALRGALLRVILEVHPEWEKYRA